MTIGGLQKLTLIDYPGKVACTVFTVGCNFRCPFCHNPELVDFGVRDLSRVDAEQSLRSKAFGPPQTINEQEFFDFLKSRQGLLDGVCVTGGEPLMQGDLPEFLKKIKDLGFLTKLDTNGTSPDKLQNLITRGLVDYVAMDIKAPSLNQKLKIKNQNLYERVVGVKVNLDNIKKSIKVIMESGLDYEFRTTVVPGLHTAGDIIKIAKEIRGAKRYYLQQFVVSEKLLDPAMKSIKPYSIEILKKIQGQIKNFFEVCEVRE